MIISHNWLQSYFKNKIPTPEKVADILTFSVFEIEGTEKKGDDTVIDVKVLPDRACYALSHIGIAGELSAAIDEILTLPELKDPSLSELTELVVNIENPDDCRRYIGRRVENVTISSSPDWLRDRLAAIGQKSINNIVDIANFVIFDVGQPLHAFDADKIKGGISIRRAKKGEKLTTLDGKALELDSETLIIADEDGPLAIAGIKGGNRAEVSFSTTKLILESANFNPTLIRKASEGLGIKTDASKRFENNISPVIARKAVLEFSALIAELVPKAQFGGNVDQYPSPQKPVSIVVSAKDISERIGADLDSKTILGILLRLGIKVSDAKGQMTLDIPPERLDLVIFEDIVDEVGRLYGYDKIQSILPRDDSHRPSAEKTFYYAEKIKNVLIEKGFSEVYTYSLVPKGFYEIEKPLAADKNYLRTDLTYGISQSLKLNAYNAYLLGLDNILIFEVGKVFTKDGESTSLCIGIKNIKRKQEREKDKIKKVRDEVLAALQSEAKILCTVDDSGGIISLNGEAIGMTNNTDGVMEVNLDKLIAGLPQPQSYGDLNFGKSVSIEYKKFSQYPFIVRDIAVFVPENVEAMNVWEVIEKGIVGAKASELVTRHSLFDTFKKDGKISYAFRIVFQSMEKTLTDDEANKIMEKVSIGVKEKGWEVR